MEARLCHEHKGRTTSMGVLLCMVCRGVVSGEGSSGGALNGALEQAEATTQQ